MVEPERKNRSMQSNTQHANIPFLKPISPNLMSLWGMWCSRMGIRCHTRRSLNRDELGSHRNPFTKHSPEPKPYPPVAAHLVPEPATVHEDEQACAAADSAVLHLQALPVAEPGQQQQQPPVVPQRPSSPDTPAKVVARTHPSSHQQLSVFLYNPLGDALHSHQKSVVHRRPTQKPPGRRDRTPRWAYPQDGAAPAVVLVVLVPEQLLAAEKACRTKKVLSHRSVIGSWLRMSMGEVEARIQLHQGQNKLNQGQAQVSSAGRSSMDPTCPSKADSEGHCQSWDSPSPVRS